MILFERPESMPLEEWLGMEDFRIFLLASRYGDVPVHYIEGPLGGRVFLSSVLLPVKLLKGNWIEELMTWNFNPSEGEWGYGTTRGRSGYVLIKPYGWERPDILQNALPIIISRYNTCLAENRHYFEANPQLTHIHDLHWLHELSAYCTVDSNGDIREVIKVIIGSEKTLVTVSEDVLFKHLLIGKYVLVRFFDVDRWVNEMPMPAHGDYDATVFWQEKNIYARLTPVPRANTEKGIQPQRAFLRGFQVIHPPTNPKARKIILEGGEKQFCTYIAIDWKHERIAEVSCDPKLLGNYFVESPYPFEISPAFFRREVLKKYQDDPEKYSIEERNISCRSLWGIRFDINEQNQVQVYLKDLSGLPYSEQLYWKSFNEVPKGGISNRSYRTDFLGEWYSEPNPLNELKNLLADFPTGIISGTAIEVWQKPSGPDADLVNRIHYLAGSSLKEWETAIVELDKLVVEGINLRGFLRPAAQILGISHETLQSIGLLRAILEAKGIAPDLISVVIDPLKELQDIRSQVGSHRKGTSAAKTIKQIKTQHRTLDNHFSDLVAKVLKSLATLHDMINHGYLICP